MVSRTPYSQTVTTAFWIRSIESIYHGPPASLPAGESHHGFSLFPPPPSAWQGIIRTRLLAATNLNLQDRSDRARKEREDLIGSPDELPDGWSIEGPVPVKLESDRLQGYFPTPLWVLKATRDGKASPLPFLALPIEGSWDSASNHPLGDFVPIGAPKHGRARAMGGWLSASDLLRVLDGRVPNPLSDDQWRERRRTWELPPGAHWETHTGIALEPGEARVREGMLYALKRIRLDWNAGLFGRLHARPAPPLSFEALRRGTQTGGRKARPFFFEDPPPRHQDWEAIESGAYLPDKVAENQLFWLYLSSPIHLKDPARPQFVLPSDIQKDGVEVHVRTALLRPPLWLGGLSIEQGRSKPNRPHVPAGSGWLITLRGGDETSRAQALRSLHCRSAFFEPGMNHETDATFGKGITFVGKLPQKGENK